ncbi:MAG: DUF5004 domain-containing protein [Bacteroidia bacterium]
MRSIIQTSMLIATLVLLFSACETREIPPIGDVPSKLEGINGNWILTSIKRTDKLACVNRPAELDISSFFIRNDAPSFAFDSDAKTFTYSSGDAPITLLPDGGSWRFINETYPEQADLYPEKVGFTPAGGTEVILDLLKPIRPVDPTLELEVTFMSDGKEATGYKMVFERKPN